MTIVLEKKGREGEECEIGRMRRLGRKRSKVGEGKGSNRGGMVYLFGMSIWGGEKE